jgi:hypothetical protein
MAKPTSQEPNVPFAKTDKLYGDKLAAEMKREKKDECE